MTRNRKGPAARITRFSSSMEPLSTNGIRTSHQKSEGTGKLSLLLARMVLIVPPKKRCAIVCHKNKLALAIGTVGKSG